MFLHDAVAEAIEGFPVKVVSPCEGTGYEIGSMSIIKGARNLEAAKRWYDFALTPRSRWIVYLSLNRCDNAIRRFKRPAWIANRDFTPIETLPDDCLVELVRARRATAAE